MQKKILVTGEVTSGKTTFLSFVAEWFASLGRIDGFLAKAPERKHCSGKFASEYLLFRIGSKTPLPWATPIENNKGYCFNQNTQRFLDSDFAQQIIRNGTDILLLDELGGLELKGRGLHKVLRSAISSDISILVATVKKRLFNEISGKYNLGDSLCIDLDDLNTSLAREKIARYLDR